MLIQNKNMKIKAYEFLETHSERIIYFHVYFLTTFALSCNISRYLRTFMTEIMTGNITVNLILPQEIFIISGIKASELFLQFKQIILKYSSPFFQFVLQKGRFP